MFALVADNDVSTASLIFVSGSLLFLFLIADLSEERMHFIRLQGLILLWLQGL